jgi:hypothetical protein
MDINYISCVKYNCFVKISQEKVSLKKNNKQTQNNKNETKERTVCVWIYSCYGVLLIYIQRLRVIYETHSCGIHLLLFLVKMLRKIYYIQIVAKVIKTKIYWNIKPIQKHIDKFNVLTCFGYFNWFQKKPDIVYLKPPYWLLYKTIIFNRTYHGVTKSFYLPGMTECLLFRCNWIFHKNYVVMFIICKGLIIETLNNLSVYTI